MLNIANILENLSLTAQQNNTCNRVQSDSHQQMDGIEMNTKT